MKPQRIQLSRRKGFNLQATSQALNGLPAVKCVRPGKWGNPFKVGIDGTAEECVKKFRDVMEGWNLQVLAREDLRGKNIACFCKLEDPCHCDVLLEIANR